MQGPKCKGKPHKVWIDVAEETLSIVGLYIQEAKKCAQDRRAWRNVCRGEQRDVVKPPV